MYVLVSPGNVMANLPPAPAVGDEAAGTYRKLPPKLKAKKVFLEPRT